MPRRASCACFAGRVTRVCVGSSSRRSPATALISVPTGNYSKVARGSLLRPDPAGRSQSCNRISRSCEKVDVEYELLANDVGSSARTWVEIAMSQPLDAAHKARRIAMLQARETCHRYCPRIGKYTDVYRTEGQCRDEHNCSEPDCPLAKEFGHPAFDTRMRVFSAALGLMPSGPNHPSRRR